MTNKCLAIQHGDLTVCEACDLRWDTNDPDAPVCRHNLARTPPHTNMSVSQALGYAKVVHDTETMQDTIVLSVDQDGVLRVVSSKMTRATAAYILQRALWHAHGVLKDEDYDLFTAGPAA